jgi:hypothetical protein
MAEEDAGRLAFEAVPRDRRLPPFAAAADAEIVVAAHIEQRMII